MHSRFEQIREFVYVRRKSMFTCLSDFVVSVHKRVKNELFVLLKKQKRTVFYL